jgi:hypothetical protein
MTKAIKKENSTVKVVMKLPPTMKREWKANAKGSGLNLSQWIKGRCND